LVKLVVGLGNPGKKYQLTRHNLGFLVIDEVAARHATAVQNEICGALTGQWAESGETIVLAKPQTYMNRSGSAVAELLRYFQGTPDDLVLIYDDVDLPFGRIRIRTRGSAGGHRGLVSIIENLAGAPFSRVRIGIGRPPAGRETADYVLQPFDAEEAAQLRDVVDNAADAVTALLKDGADAAMRQFNRGS
jgi:PTH1 family peptidyl-tRNA hydrolase